MLSALSVRLLTAEEGCATSTDPCSGPDGLVAQLPSGVQRGQPEDMSELAFIPQVPSNP